QEALQRAITAADDAHDVTLAARAWIRMLRFLGDQRKGKECLTLAFAAKSALDSAGPTRARVADLELALGEGELAQAVYAAALRQLDGALDGYGDDAAGRTVVFSNLVLVASEAEDNLLLDAASLAVVADATRAYGVNHPNTAIAHQQRGSALVGLDRFAAG